MPCMRSRDVVRTAGRPVIDGVEAAPLSLLEPVLVMVGCLLLRSDHLTTGITSQQNLSPHTGALHDVSVGVITVVR